MRIIKEYAVVENEVETRVQLVSAGTDFLIIIRKGISDDYAWLYDTIPAPEHYHLKFTRKEDALSTFSKLINIIETANFPDFSFSLEEAL